MSNARSKSRGARALAAALVATLVAAGALPLATTVARADTGGTAGSQAASIPQAQTIPATPLQPADALLVVKSERRLYLLRNGERYRSYRIALGLSPNGHKEREGDYRTPEGRYRIYRRNPKSDFFLSLGISYPDVDDERRAKQNGWKPGGAIMIHGQPNVPKRSANYYRTADWTDGCIALSNDDMLEVWLLTRTNVPIEIRP
jgi:murein L,D-transpeptidase YafK